MTEARVWFRIKSAANGYFYNIYNGKVLTASSNFNKGQRGPWCPLMYTLTAHHEYEGNGREDEWKR